MDTWEQFKLELADALNHLYDPDFRPSELLYAVTGCDSRDGQAAVQSTIIQVIESLKPAPDAPSRDRGRRIYACLHARFVQRLTQDETAELLDLSPRHLRRAQREATHVLARLLWEHSLARDASTGARASALPPAEGLAGDGQAVPDWRAQLRQELASLQQSAPGTVAQVEETVRDVADLEGVLLGRRGLRLRVGELAPGLTAAVHPAALRQVLVMAISRLAAQMNSGEITLTAQAEDDRMSVSVSGVPWEAGEAPDVQAIAEVLAIIGGDVQPSCHGGRACLIVRLPAAGRVTVLVIDDNLDLVHFYRRCTAGTRYHIVHSPQGLDALRMIQETRPDLLVLDVMLPDVDGWKLLADLHAHPAASRIPIIVCSVIREEALALALGATLYLPKPVLPDEFTQTLDRALRLAALPVSPPPVHSVTAG